jgi:hypothetical protein
VTFQSTKVISVQSPSTFAKCAFFPHTHTVRLWVCRTLTAKVDYFLKLPFSPDHCNGHSGLGSEFLNTICTKFKLHELNLRLVIVCPLSSIVLDNVLFVSLCWHYNNNNNNNNYYYYYYYYHHHHHHHHLLYAAYLYLYS